MKNSLLLAALLLPCAAQAEIWVCEQVQTATIRPTFSGDRPSAKAESGGTWIIDTEKGFKTTQQDIYEGDCQQGKMIVCGGMLSLSGGDFVSQIVIFPEIESFFMSLSMYERDGQELLGIHTAADTRMLSAAGTCTKT
jgi:hypothetical protein